MGIKMISDITHYDKSEFQNSYIGGKNIESQCRFSN